VEVPILFGAAAEQVIPEDHATLPDGTIGGCPR